MDRWIYQQYKHRLGLYRNIKLFIEKTKNKKKKKKKKKKIISS